MAETTLGRRFEGRAVLVTGAASGIGRAACERLAAEGASLACLDLNLEAAEQLAKSLRETGADAFALACDVASADDVARAVDEAVGRLGGLHVVVNSAGILRFSHSHEEDVEEWNRILAVNLTGTFLVCRSALPHLVASGGVIVNMSSSAAIKGTPWAVAYAASKGGVQALTLALAVEYGKQGVRVNCLCPGAIETPIHESFHIPDGANPKLLRRLMPLSKFGKPEDCAAAIAFLASDDARHVNGEFLRVDDAMCT
jgi:NAD(P)-dependent dehydrogenase (short-subunit alcohol dehydrogenase family)